MEGYNFINGEFTSAQGKTFDSKNPTTNQVVWQGKMATENDVKKAVKSAYAAFASWRVLSFEERCQYLEKYVAIVSAKRQALAELLAFETGKTIWESEMEIDVVINRYQISRDGYALRSGTHENIAQGTFIKHLPHGVMAVFSPFNFPAHLANAHIVPAVLAGNTVVLKPSEEAPATAQFLINCFQEANFPAGVVNLVHGDKNTGSALLNCQELAGVLFTGSYNTGKIINQHFAPNPEKILALEMGGNNPLVIMPDLELKAAAYNTVISAFLTSGQRCTCARRLILIDDPSNKILLDEICNITAQLKVGHYNQQPQAFMGGLISQSAKEKVLAAWHARIQQGAQVLVESKSLQDNSSLLAPGILDVSNCKVEDNEIFGPILQVYWAKDLNEAINIANQTEYGLSSAIFSNKRSDFDQFYANVHAGIINWNKPTSGASGNLPFGGVGHSGNHRPTALYAADYCAYPVASSYSAELQVPDKLAPGIAL